jgi:hypothetical protein
MEVSARLAVSSMLAALVIGPLPIAAQQPSTPSQAVPVRDGQHDFDWEFGTWTTNVRVLRNPLTGATPDWAEYNGTSVVRPILDGRSNTVELSVKNAKGAIEGVSLRLYNPQTRQWSLNYATVKGGTMTAPVFGGFDGKGRGHFYGQDSIDGRNVWVRFDIIPVSPREARFEQYYSADGGQSWEMNWLAIDTLQPAAASAR